MNVVLEAQHLVGYAQPRGIGYYTLNLYRELLRRKTFDYQLTFFDYKREMQSYLRTEKYFSEYGVPIHECNTLDYRVASRDDSVFEQHSYNEYTNAYGDVFHFTSFISIPPVLKGKMVVTVHDLNWITYPLTIVTPKTRAAFETGLERLNHIKPIVITDSVSSKSEILEYTDIKEENINVIDLSYDEKENFPDKQSNSTYLSELGVNGEYLLFVGGIESKKNLVRLVDAFDRVAEKNHDLYLVLCGRTAHEDPTPIIERIGSSRFADRIIMTGYVDADTKRLLYSNALGFVFISICEGFGLPLLEAMACGCPVITSNVTSLPEVAGEACILVDPYDVDQIFNEIDRLVSSAALREDMIRKGFEQCKKYSWAKAAEQTEKVYRLAAES